MRRKSLLAFIVIASVLLITAVPLLSIGCTQEAPAPAPAPAPTPAPAPSTTPGVAAPTGPTATLSMNFNSASGMQSYSVFPYRPGGRFEQLVTYYSNGRISLDIKENLYGTMDSAFAAGDGRIDITNQLVPPINGTYPLIDFGGLPGLFGDAPNTGYEWSEALIDPRMLDVLNSYSREGGFVIIGGVPSEATHGIWGNKAITKVSDFQGLKCRTGGLSQTLAMKAIGGSPITISAQELEEALSRGTVDAILTNLNYGAQRGLYDLCSHVCQWGNFSTIFSGIIIVNADKYDSLPLDLQQALMMAGNQIARECSFTIEQVMYIYPKLIKDTGTEIVYPDKAELAKAAALMEEPLKEWLKQMGPLAPQVVNIALDYATGPSRDIIAGLVK